MPLFRKGSFFGANFGFWALKLPRMERLSDDNLDPLGSSKSKGGKEQAQLYSARSQLVRHGF